jgi:hypothetical protein
MKLRITEDDGSGEVVASVTETEWQAMLDAIGEEAAACRRIEAEDYDGEPVTRASALESLLAKIDPEEVE